MSVSVTNIAAMQAVQTTFFQASATTVQTVFVETVGDFFRFQRGGTATVAANQVVASLDGQGQWHRMKIPNRRWQSQLTWSIDESNVSGKASDENTGADDTHPLLTIDEFISRVGRFGGADTVVIRWLSNTTHAGINLAPMYPDSQTSAQSSLFPVVIFVGIPTVLRTGTLTGATDAPWTIADSSLPVSWASSGLVSTSSGTRLIRKTDLTKHAFIGYENVAKTAQTSPTNGYTETQVWTPFGTAAASFTNGDAYEVLSLPTFPRVATPDCSAGFGATVFITLDMDAVLGGQVVMRHCGFRASASLNAGTRSGTHQLYGCMLFAGGQLSSPYASTTMSRSMIMGAVNMASYSGDLNTLTNVIAKGGLLLLAHASFPHLGNVYAYDCTSNPVIQITNNSAATFNSINGSSNTGVIVDVRDPGCSANSRQTSAAFVATTSAGSQITVAGVAKNWSDLPYWATNQNAGFATA